MSASASSRVTGLQYSSYWLLICSRGPTSLSAVTAGLGESDFESVLELAKLDPVTRSTLGLGTGVFVDSAATDIQTQTDTSSWYFTNTIDFTPKLALTLSGRYNDTDVTLRDRSGARPELNGDHGFARFNPALGFAWSPDADLTI